MADVRTLKQLADEVLNWLDKAGETGTPQDVVYDTIRRLHAARVTEKKWNFMLWSEPKSFSTVVGQRHYSLHQEFFRPVYFYNTSSRRFLEENNSNTFMAGIQPVPDWDFGVGGTNWTDAAGTAYAFQYQGVSPVANQPTSASVITASGQNSVTVTIKGETADGVTEETITATVGGAAGSVQFTKILGVTKGDGWTATLTLTSNAAAVTNLKLFATEGGREYRQIYLLNTPTAVEPILYLFYRQPSSLSSDNSIPDIPSPFSRILVYDALLEMGLYNGNLSGAMRAHWTSEQQRLELGLLETYEGQDTLNAAVEYTPYTPRT